MLASILMESTGFIGSPDVSADALAKYGYNSEHQIAMESAIALNDIFVESFYEMEELDFKHTYAAMEGVSDVVLEGIAGTIKEKSKAAIEKIKKFVKDLWEKVKAFFHNIKRFLLGVFMNAEDFVKKYEKELLALTFKDKSYEVQLYEYRVDDNNDAISASVKEFSKIFGDECRDANGNIDKGVDTVEQAIRYNNGRYETSDQLKERMDKLKADVDNNTIIQVIDDKLLSIFGKYGLQKDFTSSDLANAAWSFVRNGATDSNDMKTVTVTSLSEYVTYLKTSKSTLSKFDAASRTADKTFSDAIKFYDGVQSKMEKKTSDNPRTKMVYELSTAYCRYTSTGLSKLQGYVNTMFGVERTAIQEKISAYKRVCTGAFAHADKKDKKKDK